MDTLEQEAKAAQDTAQALDQEAIYYAKQKGITPIEVLQKWEAGDPEIKPLIDSKLPLFVVKNIFEKIITECDERATIACHLQHGHFTVPELAEKLNDDPIYLLASEGLKTVVQAM